LSSSTVSNTWLQGKTAKHTQGFFVGKVHIQQVITGCRMDVVLSAALSSSTVSNTWLQGKTAQHKQCSNMTG
jgi:hypothetical protein